MTVGAHRHPWVVGTRGRCGGSGVRSSSLVEGGGSKPSLSSLVVGSWTQEFGGGDTGMDKLISYSCSCRRLTIERKAE